MNVPFLPRPSREQLLTEPLHVLVRDFPETLHEFRAHGIAVDELGDRTVGDLEDPGELIEDLEASTLWRPGLEEA